jgi:hypothetical protein
MIGTVRDIDVPGAGSLDVGGVVLSDERRR